MWSGNNCYGQDAERWVGDVKIVVADDEVLVLEHLVSVIEQAAPGAPIVQFSRASSLLEYAADNVIDVAFLDVQMPVISGVEMAEKLKIFNPNINIIFVTGYDEYMTDAFKMHASGYIAKPATLDKVQRELHDLRYQIQDSRPKVSIHTFGPFGAAVNEVPLRFAYAKSKEILALLIDKLGEIGKPNV